MVRTARQEAIYYIHKRNLYTKVPIKHAERKDGKSSYSLKKRWKLAINTILAFSDKPLRITVKLGVSLSFLSIIAAIVLVILYFLN